MAIIGAVLALILTACYPIYDATCNGTLVTSSAGPISDPAIVEISGIDAGVRNPGIWWVHNDSGDTARVFALDASGTTRGTFSFEGTPALDWEDLAVIPGPAAQTGMIYAADIGDNTGTRAEIQVYRVAEPYVPLTGTPLVTTLSGVETLHLTYPDGAHDAEALMIDPIFGDLVIVAKSFSGGNANIYRAPANLSAGSTTALTKVGQVKLGTGLGNAVTGGDVTADGKSIAIRTYGQVRVFGRVTSSPLANALGGQPCSTFVPSESQGEAVGFSPNGKAFVTVSEGTGQMLHRFSAP